MFFSSTYKKIDNNTQIIEYKNGDCVIKKNNKYYFKDNFYPMERYGINSTDIKIRINMLDLIYGLMFLFLFVMVTFLIHSYLNLNINKLTNMEILYMFLFLIFNIMIHEFGHYITLTSYGKKRGKIRMKWFYFIPAITIDTSEAYMLPKFRRIIVLISGVWVNVFVCFLIAVLIPKYSLITYPVFTTSMINLLPFGGIKSDGYQIIYAALGNKESRSLKIISNMLIPIILLLTTISYISIFSTLLSLKNI